MLIKTVDLGYETLSNCYLLIDEETSNAAVVDPGFYTENLEKAIKENNITVTHILLTHGHFDHILGVAELKRATGAKVYIHKNDAECLKSKLANLMIRFRVEAPFTPSEADEFVDEGSIIKIGNSAVKVLHTPGHSGGSVCYVDEENRSIISGDTLFLMTAGRTDTPDGSDEQLKNSLFRLIDLDGDYDVFPGHGGATALSNERVRNIIIRRLKRN